MTSHHVARVGLAAMILSFLGFGTACERLQAPGSDSSREAAASLPRNPKLPGFDRVDAELQTRLDAAVRAKGPDLSLIHI